MVTWHSGTHVIQIGLFRCPAQFVQNPKTSVSKTQKVCTFKKNCITVRIHPRNRFELGADHCISLREMFTRFHVEQQLITWLATATSAKTFWHHWELKWHMRAPARWSSQLHGTFPAPENSVQMSFHFSRKETYFRTSLRSRGWLSHHNMLTSVSSPQRWNSTFCFPFQAAVAWDFHQTKTL